MTQPVLSIVVPALNEEAALPALLGDAAALGPWAEVVVADGGSEDATARVAREAGARVVTAAPGRGTQLLAGAARARGTWFFFVHADTRIPPRAREALRAFVEAGDEGTFAHFRFRLDGSGAFLRFIEFGQGIRERLLRLPYGDQGLVVHRRLYEAAGGHPPWPLMEDVEVFRRLARVGRRVRLAAALPTSPRRYLGEGGWRAWVRNVFLIARFRLGARPERLAERYRPPLPSPWRLAVFAKAPRPGAVKTRLGREIGDERAAGVYRALARHTVRAVLGGPFRITVWYAPAGSGDEVRDMMAVPGLGYRPQTEGDLGERMEHALRHELEDGSRACVIGTDAPDVDRRIVEGAFRALDGADTVLGPAADGGFYLLGARRPLPHGLLSGIEWSTPSVAAETRARLRAAGLTIAELVELRDVDHAADVPPSLLAG